MAAVNKKSIFFLADNSWFNLKDESSAIVLFILISNAAQAELKFLLERHSVLNIAEKNVVEFRKKWRNIKETSSV